MLAGGIGRKIFYRLKLPFLEDRRMRKLTTILLVLLALSGTLYADTAAFPKYDSVFTITVPEDMNVKVDSDAMVLRTKEPKDLASFVFIELSSSEAHDSESARKFVETIRRT
jgi:hypothetical protein